MLNLLVSLSVFPARGNVFIYLCHYVRVCLCVLVWCVVGVGCLSVFRFFSVSMCLCLCVLCIYPWFCFCFVCRWVGSSDPSVPPLSVVYPCRLLLDCISAHLVSLGVSGYFICFLFTEVQRSCYAATGTRFNSARGYSQTLQISPFPTFTCIVLFFFVWLKPLLFHSIQSIHSPSSTRYNFIIL